MAPVPRGSVHLEARPEAAVWPKQPRTSVPWSASGPPGQRLGPCDSPPGSDWSLVVGVPQGMRLESLPRTPVLVSHRRDPWVWEPSLPGDCTDGSRLFLTVAECSPSGPLTTALKDVAFDTHFDQTARPVAEGGEAG